MQIWHIITWREDKVIILFCVVVLILWLAFFPTFIKRYAHEPCREMKKEPKAIKTMSMLNANIHRVNFNITRVR